jgi:hypothetical protein
MNHKAFFISAIHPFNPAPLPLATMQARTASQQSDFWMPLDTTFSRG